MSVRKRKWKAKDGTMREGWMVHIERQTPDGKQMKPIRKMLSGMSKRDAEEWERHALSALANGTYGTEVKRVPTVAEFATDYIETYAKTNNKPSEVRSKEMHLKHHVLPEFGKLALDAVTKPRIEKFKAKKLEQGLKPKSVNNSLAVLSGLLSVAVEWDLIPAKPKVKLLKDADPEFDFLEFEELDRLVAAAEEPWRSVITVAARTGLRPGEWRALRWVDVDLVGRKIVVRQNRVNGQEGTPKNGRKRTVDLSEQAVAALRRHKHLRGPYVFCREDGTPLDEPECRAPLRRASRLAGLREVNWYTLRHTFASHLAMRGVPLRAIQELMGHATVTMTLRYAHLSPATTRAAVAALDQPAPAVNEDAGSRPAAH